MGGLFGSTILEVALSLFFIYFLLSLMCSHVNELIAGLFKSRAKDLERGIENLVCDPDTARAVLDHPLIKALGNTDAETLPVRLFTKAEAAIKRLEQGDFAGKPEYIPARTFAMAIFDQLVPAEERPITVERLRRRALELAEGTKQEIDPIVKRLNDLNLDQPATDPLRQATAAAKTFDQLRTVIEQYRARFSNEKNRSRRQSLEQPYVDLLATFDGKRSLGKALLSLIDQSGVSQRFAVTAEDVKTMIEKLLESAEQAAGMGAGGGVAGQPASSVDEQRALKLLRAAIDSAGTLDEIRKSVTLLPDSSIRGAVLDFLDKGQSELAAVRKSVELWYDSAMERVSGVYKRRTQVWLLVTAALISGGIGADSVNMAQTLFRNADLRQSLADRAGQVATTPDGAFVVPATAGTDGSTTVTTTVRLGSTGPMTTTTTTMVISSTNAILDELDTVRQLFDYEEIWSGTWVGSFAGWGWFLGRLPGMLITTIAISLGAPFWFDLLQRFVNVRSAGSKPARSAPEEQAASKEKG